MANWNQPMCEACWFEQRGEWDGDRLLSYQRPAFRADRPLRQCAFCGAATISGILVRHNPDLVAYPQDEP